MKLKCSMDGGCFILQPEAGNSLTILINIWYFSLEKRSEQVIFTNNLEKKLTIGGQFFSNWCIPILGHFSINKSGS